MNKICLQSTAQTNFLEQYMWFVCVSLFPGVELNGNSKANGKDVIHGARLCLCVAILYPRTGRHLLKIMLQGIFKEIKAVFKMESFLWGEVVGIPLGIWRYLLMHWPIPLQWGIFPDLCLRKEVLCDCQTKPSNDKPANKEKSQQLCAS